MVFLGYEAGSKAYRLFDPDAGRVVISRDVVFDESARWNWEESGDGEDRRGGIDSSFSVEYSEYFVATYDAAEASHQDSAGGSETGGASSSPGAGESTPTLPVASPPPSPAATPTRSPAGQGTPTSATSSTGSSVRFVTPPPNASTHVDAEHEGEPLRFRAIRDLVGDEETPGHAERVLDDQELHLGTAEEPATFAAAEHENCWRAAMLKEMAAIQENHTWELVDPPIGCRPIGLKWVYKVKRDEKGNVVRYKARLVAKGYVQRDGIDVDEVFAPVARMDSVRVLLALAATRGWNVHHLDVKSAFLNDELEEVVFVRQPPGFFIPGQEHMVLRLKKALYTRRSRRGLLIVGVYVDDLIVTGESEDDAAEFKREMMKKFKMSDLGLLSYYLGVEVVVRGGLSGCKPCQTPMEEKLKLSKESTAARVNATDYRSMIGGLRYLTHKAGYRICSRLSQPIHGGSQGGPRRRRQKTPPLRGWDNRSWNRVPPAEGEGAAADRVQRQRYGWGH
jgi:hypothetical protein